MSDIQTDAATVAPDAVPTEAPVQPATDVPVATDAPVSANAAAPQQTPASPDTAQDDTGSAPNPIDELYGQNGKAPAPAQPQVPETYDFSGIELPEGTSIGDGQNLVTDLGHELKLSNEQARALLEKGMPKVTASIQARRDQLVSMWTNQIKSDPVLGGEHYAETSANLSRVMNKYGSKEAYAVLNQSGLGSNPAIVRMMNAIGKDLGEEDKFINSSVTAQSNKAARLRLRYPNSPNLVYED